MWHYHTERIYCFSTHPKEGVNAGRKSSDDKSEISYLSKKHTPVIVSHNTDNHGHMFF